ncbi:DUF1631 family protein [Hydrogenophaga sp. BPS33]|uniref:DUF1631 family protein n=1 Tax=Hydrogenophaga sp. BPS33 TaxID=2651974 RepID=UPI00131FAAC6|nr:DUF1631 family protein [Hydrogenophaga sp. BPS33]QHE85303.1 DUF1631 domain-containing protein [Hydrogenophaga sp. BPS33]
MDVNHNQAFDACIRDALVQARTWIPRWVGQLQGALKEREAVASHLSERQGLLQARTQLETHRDLIATRFLSALGDTIGSSAPDAGGHPRRSATVSFDELELMGDDQVQETVEQARVQQVVKMAVDDELVRLTARLSSAQGLSVMNPDANPLRVEVFVAALMKSLKSVHVDAAVRARWLQVGAIPLGDALRDMYTQLSRQLERAGVKPAGFGVSQTPSARPSAAAQKDESVSVQEVMDDDNLLTLDHLHQLLVGNLDLNDKSKHPNATSDNAMGRTLASEVVTLMLKRIAADERLLAPVRHMLLDMKPALLQLARSEPRFFSDKQNPARRLLDAITERSLAFTSERDSGFDAFSKRVHAVVRALREPGDDLADRFPAQLDALERSQAAAVAPAQVQARGLAVQTLVRVEQRNLLAERVATEIRTRNDFPKTPGVVRRFLTGPWSQVIAQARLEEAGAATQPHGRSAAQRYTDMLPDLMWSSQLALASLNRPRLVKIIPTVLRTLREGLDSIDYPREKTEAFFQALMGMHEAAYKTQRNDAPSVDEQLSVPPDLDDEPWMQRNEARDSCLMDDVFKDGPPTTTQPAFQETQRMQRDWADVKTEIAAQHTTDIPVGTWVDILQEGQAARWQITWASPHGTLFLFTGSDGRSLSMTKRGFERLLEQDRLRVVAQNGVVDAALDEVARQAWLNSAKATNFAGL